MGLFDNMLHSDESLFKNDLALSFEFIPKLIPYREKQQRFIAECIKPLFNARDGKHVLVYGKPGIGKTVACKKIFQELEEETDDIYVIYVNCWKRDSSFKILLDICAQLGLRFVQNMKTEELFAMLKEELNKKAAVFAFDEIDKAKDFDFLYSILEEIYKKTIILITNRKDWIAEMDSRIKSRLLASMLEFRPYNFEETKGILEHRLGYAFIDAVWSGDAFELVAKKTYELADIRCGLQMLRDAGLAAEDKSSRKILLEHAGEAVKKIDEFSIKSSDSLGEDERLILDVIKENSGSKMGDLFKKYAEKEGMSAYRTFHRKVCKLGKDKFASIEKRKGGIEGNISIVRYKQRDKNLNEF